MYLSQKNFICRLSEVDPQVTGLTLGGGREAIFELKANNPLLGSLGVWNHKVVKLGL